MAAFYEKNIQSSLKLPLERLRFWDNSWLLTTCGCRECMFVSEDGPGVRTITPLSYKK